MKNSSFFHYGGKFKVKSMPYQNKTCISNKHSMKLRVLILFSFLLALLMNVV